MDYSNASSITLGGHVELQKYRYFYFLVTLTVYLLILLFNGIIVSVIVAHKRLHEPMYVFIAALLCNALFGTTCIYPKLLVDLLSENQTVSYAACAFQSYFIVTYGASEFALLSAMAYDRYVSICKPLQYANIMKMSTVKMALLLCWIVPSCETGVGLILTFQYKPCRFKLNRIYCNSAAVVRLSCDDISVKTTYGQVLFVFAVFPPVIFICYSYLRIFKVCIRSSKNSRRKALQTCVPHILAVIGFTFTSCFEFICNRMESNIPHLLSMVMSVENLVIAPLVNPVIYGLKLQDILSRIKSMIRKSNKRILF